MPNCENYRKLTSDKDDYTSSPNDAYDEGIRKAMSKGVMMGVTDILMDMCMVTHALTIDYYENMLDRAAVLQP